MSEDTINAVASIPVKKAGLPRPGIKGVTIHLAILNRRAVEFPIPRKECIGGLRSNLSGSVRTACGDSAKAKHNGRAEIKFPLPLRQRKGRGSGRDLREVRPLIVAT